MDLTILMKFTITLKGEKPAELDMSSAELGTNLGGTVPPFSTHLNGTFVNCQAQFQQAISIEIELS